MNQWYVVKTKYRKEATAYENLERQGYHAYCPKMSFSKRIKGQWKKVTEPLFPCYLFIRLQVGLDNFSPIRSTLGVLDLVRFGRKPAVISGEIIAEIQEQELQHKNSSNTGPLWNPGDEVEIVSGPFENTKGIFESMCGDERVILLLNLLGRPSKVNLSVNSVAPV